MAATKWFALCSAMVALTGGFRGGNLQEQPPSFRDSREMWLPGNLLDLPYYYYRYGQEEEIVPPKQDVSVQPPLMIGAFNVQTLTDKKIQRTDVMDTVIKVILRYDIILITELHLRNFQNLERVMTTINRLAGKGRYKVTASVPHPVTNESCAFIYRSDKLAVEKSETYLDQSGIFYRKPLIVHFRTNALRDMSDFVALGLHVKPNKAVQELDGLATVYDTIRSKHGISDVMMMGDFNADCTYVKESDWQNISLWTRLDFTWPITRNMDTTTNYRSCALDRFVYAGDNMNKGVIMSSARVFNFQEAYGLDLVETRKISDHFPIEIQVRGKASPKAEDHLKPGICITLGDSRTVNISLDKDNLRDQATAAGLKMSTTRSGNTIIVASEIEGGEVMKTMRKIDSFAPGLVSPEQMEALDYKLKYGSLKDDSSYADIPDPTTFRLTVLHHNLVTTVVACVKTTIN